MKATNDLREWTTDRIKSLQEKSKAIGLTEAEQEELECLENVVNGGEPRLKVIDLKIDSKELDAWKQGLGDIE